MSSIHRNSKSGWGEVFSAGHAQRRTGHREAHGVAIDGAINLDLGSVLVDPAQRSFEHIGLAVVGDQLPVPALEVVLTNRAAKLAHPSSIRLRRRLGLTDGAPGSRF